MFVGYMVPVDSHGYSTRSENAKRRELWCKVCASPTNPDYSVPMDHIAISDYQVLPGESCQVCGKGL